MNWDQLLGKWKQLAGSAREGWRTLSSDDWSIIAQKRHEVVRKIQTWCDISKEEAERRLNVWSQRER